jgi:hypothetical protein
MNNSLAQEKQKREKEKVREHVNYSKILVNINKNIPCVSKNVWSSRL